MTNQDYRRASSRQELSSLLRTAFPHLRPEDTALSPTRGGRAAAEMVLAAIDPREYERSRNFLDGRVTHLSAFLRHGVLTLAEVRDRALRLVARPDDAKKLVNELGWRDYWQRLYTQIGEGIWQDREAIKTGLQPAAYSAELTEEIPAGTTTLRCMDSFSRQLTETGYLHNHARLWFASYIVHWRRVRWQAGARWFLRHLVDGDPASNNLSWQWVASTFSSKPYIFNRENLQHYTADSYCRECVHAREGTCPFDRDYEALEQQLFPRWNERADQSAMPTPPRAYVPAVAPERSLPAHGKPLLWIHTDGLNPDSAMLYAHPGRPAVFLWDLEWLIEADISLKRMVFLAECLAEMPGEVEVRSGRDLAAELLAAAQATGAEYILAQRTPDPRLKAAAAGAAKHVPVVWYDPPAFAETPRAFDLKRFSRYWQKAQGSAMRPTGT